MNSTRCACDRRICSGCVARGILELVCSGALVASLQEGRRCSPLPVHSQVSDVISAEEPGCDARAGHAALHRHFGWCCIRTLILVTNPAAWASEPADRC